MAILRLGLELWASTLGKHRQQRQERQERRAMRLEFSAPSLES
jgi:hypothetical protein